MNPAIASAPRPDFLLSIWRGILHVTRRHGLFTLARFHTRLFPSGQIVSLPAGAKLFIPPDSHFFGFALGTHENHITELLEKYVRPGDTCIDVGANIGYFAAILAELVGATGNVLAFEPVPENFNILIHNTALAESRGRHIRPVNAAVSAAKGELKIVRQRWSTYHQVAAITRGDTDVDRVSAVPLDEIIEALPDKQSVALLKVDVEGHELQVVEGLGRSVAAGRIRRMVIEITPGVDAAAIAEILKPHARHVKIWVDGQWREGSLNDILERTDVFVEFVSA